MNLGQNLLGKPSLAKRDKIIAYIGDDADKFNDLFFNLKGTETNAARMAAWVVTNVVDNHPDLIHPYQRELADILTQPGIHDAIKRNILRIFQEIEIQKNLE